MAILRCAKAWTRTPVRALRSFARGSRLRCSKARSAFGTADPALLALACCHYQTFQKLSLVTSRKRPKHLRLGLVYFFMVMPTFPFSI